MEVIHTMNRYYNLMKRVSKLEKLIYNKRPKFESLGCYKQDGEVIDAEGENEITSILEDKIKSELNISDSALEDIFAAIDDDSHTENLQAVVNKIIKAGKGEIPRKTIYRGCSVAEYNNMISSISETGSVRLADIKTNIYDKPTLLKADLMLMAMGLKTDLISESYYSIDKVKAAMDKYK